MNIGKYLFVSIDLCGSTQLKYNFKLWPGVIVSFYRDVKKLSSEIEGMEGPILVSNFSVLKQLGDEIVLYVELENVYHVFRCMNSLQKLRPYLRKSSKGYVETYKIVSSKIFGEEAMSNEIDVKFTAWLSFTDQKITGQLLMPNRLDFPVSDPFDIVGPFMDQGFRLCKFATPERITLSQELAAVILANNFDEMGIKLDVSLVSRRRLKGIPGRSLVLSDETPIVSNQVLKAIKRRMGQEFENVTRRYW